MLRLFLYLILCKCSNKLLFTILYSNRKVMNIMKKEKIKIKDLESFFLDDILDQVKQRKKNKKTLNKSKSK